MNQPDLNKLKSTLLTSGLQQSNPPLYQVINSLIDAVRQFQGITINDINAINQTINNITNDVNNFNGNAGTLGLLLDLDDSNNESLIPGPKGNDGINGLNGMNGLDGIDGEDAAYYILGQLIPTTSSGSGLTQPQVCKLVSLRA